MFVCMAPSCLTPQAQNTQSTGLRSECKRQERAIEQLEQLVMQKSRVRIAVDFRASHATVTTYPGKGGRESLAADRR